MVSRNHVQAEAQEPPDFIQDDDGNVFRRVPRGETQDVAPVEEGETVARVFIEVVVKVHKLEE